MNNSKWLVFSPLVLALAVIMGMFINQWLSNNKMDNKLLPQQPASKLNTLINYIEQEYVDSVSMDALIEKSIPKILENLDPHSVYIPAAELERVNEPLEGNFDGVGIQFNIQKDTITVIKVIENGPSAKVGVRDGDRIVYVGDTLVAGVKITNEKVMSKLRGLKGTEVKIKVHRAGLSELLDFSIIRDKIPLYSVDVSYMIDNRIGYIKLSKFSRTTATEFVQAVDKLKALGMKKVIVDLRGNGGGFMDEAVEIADEFLPKNKLVVFTQGNARPKATLYSTANGNCEDYPVILLIDEWSASASEILAGAIQDNDRGLIIGRRSFGKGLVQEPVMFADGSSMRLTIARYYTPSGRCIQRSYKDGMENYYNDIGNRINHGEFNEEDSIRFIDSLQYNTVGGRIVYGGGGIMPDVFVPLDTIGTSPYFIEISRKGLEYNFAFEFTDQNRTKLSSFKTVKELASFLDSQKILDQFVKYAVKNGVPVNPKGIKRSGDIIEIQVKALIARNIFDNDGFYPIIEKIDATLLKAIDIIKDDQHMFEKYSVKK